MGVLWIAVKGAVSHLWVAFLAGGAVVIGHLSLAGALWVVLFAGTALRASMKAKSTENRLAAHIVATAPAVKLVASGGNIGGTVTVAGHVDVGGNDLKSSGNVGSPPGSGAAQFQGGGLTISGGQTVGGDIHVSGVIYPNGSPGLSMGGNIAMNSHNAYGGGTYT